MAFVNRDKAPVNKGHIVILTLYLLGLPRIIKKILLLDLIDNLAFEIIEIS
jgi:hypothetical protein